MRKRAIFVSLVVALLIAVAIQAGADNAAAPLSTPELRQMLSSGKQTLVFFLNPNGGPCKSQNEILLKLLKDRKNNFNVAYVSAMIPENQKAFYDYGVRSLPSIVLVDQAGKISRVFPPGIQTYDALAAALDKVK